MKEQKDKEQRNIPFDSNPEKSFEQGKKGGKPSTETSNQSSNVVNSSKTNGSSTSSGEHHSRVGRQNKPQQGKGGLSDEVGSNDAGSQNKPTA